MTNQEIRIDLIDDNGKSSGKINIKAQGKIENSSNFTKKNVELINVPKVNVPDDETPIQYLTNEKIKIPKIMLLEETEYQVKIESPTNNKLKLTNNLSRYFKPFNYDLGSEEDNIQIGILNFGSYVGKSFIELINEKNPLDNIPIEVRSKKMHYFKQYPKILADLGDFLLSLILNSDSPVFQEFSHDKKRSKTLYEDFMYLEYIFTEDNLINDLEFINRHVYKIIKRKKEIINSNLAKKLLPNDLRGIINKPQYLRKVDEGSSFKSLKGYFPEKIEQNMAFESVDNNENRFLKYFLENLSFLIVNMLNDTSNGYIEDKLLFFKDIIDYYLSQRWFKEIKPLKFIPFYSQVLQKKEGYRNILKYFINLNLSFKYEWEEVTSQIKGNEKKLSTLYEYWCYIKLLNVLNEITGESVDASDIFNLEDKKWTISLKNQISKVFRYENIKIHFNYNKTFTQNKKKYKSYSLNLKPDYSLLIEKEKNKFFFIHFDAKYRATNEILDNYTNIKNNNDNNIRNQIIISEEEIEEQIAIRDGEERLKNYKKGDIYKMHTYKDAILSSEGAYIFYPGNEFEIFEVEKGKKIPSVGAFSLNPGFSSEEEDNLKKFLLEILNSI